MCACVRARSLDYSPKHKQTLHPNEDRIAKLSPMEQSGRIGHIYIFVYLCVCVCVCVCVRA